jgi:hypothetical protein
MATPAGSVNITYVPSHNVPLGATCIFCLEVIDLNDCIEIGCNCHLKVCGTCLYQFQQRQRMYRPPLPFRCPTCRANINPTGLRDYNVAVVAPTQDQIERDEQEVYILNDEIYSRSSRSIQMIEEAFGHVRRQPVLRAPYNLNNLDAAMIGIREARIAAMFTGYPLTHYLAAEQNVFVGRTKPNNTFYVEPPNGPQTLFLINAYYGLGSNLCTYYF